MIQIGGDIQGGIGNRSASIYVDADFLGGNKYVGGVLGSVVVGGSVIGGAGLESACLQAFRSIGAIQVAHDWIGASAVAGWTAGADGYFGNGDDVANNVVSSIGKISIGETLDGTATANDAFAFRANRIGALTNGVLVIPLTAGPDTLPIGTMGDFQLTEV
jgi:hypothetical protein